MSRLLASDTGAYTDMALIRPHRDVSVRAGVSHLDSFQASDACHAVKGHPFQAQRRQCSEAADKGDGRHHALLRREGDGLHFQAAEAHKLGQCV